MAATSQRRRRESYLEQNKHGGSNRLTEEPRLRLMGVVRLADARI